VHADLVHDWCWVVSERTHVTVADGILTATEKTPGFALTDEIETVTVAVGDVSDWVLSFTESELGRPAPLLIEKLEKR